jgi:tetratricopeptide (TPR) repeat protein
MKTFIVTLASICIIAATGTIVYRNLHKAPPVPAPATAASPDLTTNETPPEQSIPPKPEAARTASGNADEPGQVPVTNAAPDNVKPAGTESALSQAVDTLISAQTSFSDRKALLKQLKDAGELDQAIADLKQREAGNPNDPEIPTALGEALMNKFPVKDFNDAAMFGVQIDQSFDAALKLDPANWEAQFYKADSMSYWPAVAGDKGPELIQRLSGLIDQQETMPPQPQFAQTYVLLGEQYQKAGQSDQAQATWQLGLARFPNDPTLRQKTGNP